MCKVFLVISIAVLLIVFRGNAQNYVKVIYANDSVHQHNTIPVNYTGKASECYEYRDKKGTHLFLVTSTDIKRNFLGNCYIKIDNKWVPEWQIKDKVDYDWVITNEHTNIVDINHDGIFENIFIYSVISEKGGRVYSVRSWVHFKNENYDASIYQGEFDADGPITSMGASFLDVPKYMEAYVRKLLNISLKQLMGK